MDNELLSIGAGEPDESAPDAQVEQPWTDRPPSRWLVLAFAALLSILVLLGTTGIGAAASTLLGGQPVDCGGP